MVRNTPRKRAPWRTRMWRRWHGRHQSPDGARGVVSVTYPTYRDDPFGIPRYRADLSKVVERCARGHERRVR